MFYVIAYDVVSSRRRRKVATLLEGYGRRAQWSVFECILTDRQFASLKARLRQRVDLSEDRVRIYAISGHTLPQAEVWGGTPLLEPPRSTIV